MAKGHPTSTKLACSFFCLSSYLSFYVHMFDAVCAECPLVFNEPIAVAKACDCTDAPSNITCCTALNSYLSDLQQQMLITNLQALHCVTYLASVLQNMSVSADIYSLCQIELNAFSLQGKFLLVQYVCTPLFTLVV